MLRGLTLIAGSAIAFGLAGAAPAPAADRELRPPAVPLIACDPYFSVWSNANRLTDAPTRHWTGKRQALSSSIRVDGKPYRLMGNEPKAVPPLEQTSVKVLPTRTIYTFEGAGVGVTLTFMTAALPDDLDVLSRPLTYVTWDVASRDGKGHAARVYFGASSELAVDTPDQKVIWSRETVGDLTVLKVGTEDQPVLRRKGDDLRIDWGHAYVAAKGEGSISSIGMEQQLADALVSGPGMQKRPRQTQSQAVREGVPTLAFAFDLGTVAADRPANRHLIVAYDDEYSISFFGKKLRPYWRRNGADAAQLLKQGEAEYESLLKRCVAFDDELMADLAKAGGARYAAIAGLAYRQSLAAHKLVADANGQPLLFSKENFSNGCIATVDITYPTDPIFLLLSPTLAKASLATVLGYAASDRWKFPFAPHDIGTYPLANGQVYGGGERSEDDQMPVEETGNVLILLAAIAKVEGNADFAASYWPTLSNWAKYLEAKGFDPENQLCTDDFAGHLAHNVNLSAKAIMGIASFGYLCDLKGEKEEGARYRAVAAALAKRWVQEATEGDHTRLAFDRPGSWSQKYNLVWDRLLGFNLFPAEVFRSEIAFYLRNQNAYGLPLDSRKTYTKLDWIVWTATMADDPADFEALIAPVYRFLDETPTRVPMCDWYDTQDAKQSGFQARSVVGGVFIKMLADPSTWKKWASRDKARASDWAPLPRPPALTAVVPTARDQAASWRMTTRKPAEGWADPGFDDSGWAKAEGGFGTRSTPGTAGALRTEWNTPDIWIRREFTMPEGSFADLQLSCFHDEDAEITINGVPAARLSGFTTDYDLVPINPKARATLKPGQNVIAVHCHQTTGGQYIDVGVVDVKEGGGK
ncbi:glutaminase domain-containing protein [Tundrisphaera sp. TA3]|uniref:glutaminase family protein n=1 Tax=Tundrisphaera sp. TA3 TaxID=3435775 RepID=UPI003EBA7869